MKLWQIANEERNKAVQEAIELGQRELKQCQENAEKEKVNDSNFCIIKLWFKLN